MVRRKEDQALGKLARMLFTQYTRWLRDNDPDTYDKIDWTYVTTINDIADATDRPREEVWGEVLDMAKEEL